MQRTLPTMEKEKKYAVIFLPFENIHSEVPTNWLTKDKTKCWWPKSLNAQLLMKRGEIPNDTWNLHEARIEAYCSTLESARRKAEDPEFSSTSNENETMGRGRRKKVNRNISPSSDSSCETNETMTPPPSPVSADLKKNTSSVSDGQHVVMKKNPTDMKKVMEPDENIELVYLDENTKSDSINNIPATPPGSITVNELSSQIARLKNICLTNQKYLEDMNKILKSIVQKEGEHAVDVHLNKIQENIPLKTLEDLKAFDVRFTEVDGMNKTFGSFIKSIGGRDLRDHINRCLLQIFGNELATKCSWHGQRGNFKLSNLNVMKILTEVMLCLHKDARLNEVEKHATEWFRLSQQRLKREKK